MDDEWDESYPAQRLSSEFTFEILDALIRRGMSKATALLAAREILAACPDDFDLDRWILRVEKAR